MKEQFPKANIVGIIPAAGKGSRLAPFPCPKELFPVGYQDYIIDGQKQKRPKVVSQYLLDNIIRAGAQRIVFIVGDGKHDLMRYYGDGSRFSVDICYLYQEVLSGMPGALALAKPWIDDATVVFGMPDTIIEPFDAFEQMLSYHQQTNAELTLGLFTTDNPSKFGMVATDEENNVVYTIDKPKETDLTNMWGCACWSPSFTQLLSNYIAENKFDGREIVLGDIFNRAIKLKMKVKGLLFEGGQYIDIGTTDELDTALKKFHL
jgi:glucose-1-phosphate thymidylyltransferase